MLLERVFCRAASKQVEKRIYEMLETEKDWKHDLKRIAEKSLYRLECGLENNKEIIWDLIQVVFKFFVFLFLFFIFLLQNQQDLIKIPETLSNLSS